MQSQKPPVAGAETLGPLAVENFRVAEWVYFTELDDGDPDVRKLSHFAVHATTGRVVNLDVSPYEQLRKGDFTRLIACGFPRRDAIPSFGPLRSEDIWAIWRSFVESGSAA